MKLLLFTGGLDSFMAWRRLGQPTCLYVRHEGNPYAPAEMMAIAMLSDELMLRGEQFDIVYAKGRQSPPLPDGHVPHRNLSLLTAAACAGADVIYLGAVKGEASPDKSARFLRAASRALSASEHTPIRVEAPLRTATKATWLRRHLSDFPEDRDLLVATRTCYEGAPQCGRCLACFRRWVAFTLAGLPQEYETDPGERVIVAASLRYLAGTPVAEWPGIIRNNLDALRALRRKHAV